MRLERKARKHDNAVIALLAVKGDVLIAETLEALERKLVVRALRLLQAQHVRPRRLDKLRDQIDAQAHRIDVPGGDGELLHSGIAEVDGSPEILTGSVLRKVLAGHIVSRPTEFERVSIPLIRARSRGRG